MEDDYYFTVCCFASATIKNAHGIIRQVLTTIALAAGADPSSLVGELCGTVDLSRTDPGLSTDELERTINQKRCNAVDVFASLSEHVYLERCIGDVEISRPHVASRKSTITRVNFDYDAAQNTGRLITDAVLVISFPASLFEGSSAGHVADLCESLVKLLDASIDDTVCCFIDYAHSSHFASGTGYVPINQRLCTMMFEIDHLRWIRFVGPVPLRLRNVFWITHLTKAHVDALGGFQRASQQIREEINPFQRRDGGTVVAQTGSGGMYIRLFEMPCLWPDPRPLARDPGAAIKMYNIFRTAGFFAWK